MLLRVANLKTYFEVEGLVYKVLNGVDLALERGKVLAIIGESGCGKTILGLSIMGLIQPPGRIASGEIWFEEKNVSEIKVRHGLLGRKIGMIFQDALASLCPVLTVGHQISEVLWVHKRLSKSEAMRGTMELLKRVEINVPERRIREYPFQLSGGMRQRVLIAMALAAEPALLIADECTSGLDVTIQAQVRELMRRLKKSMDTSILLLTHDLGAVVDIADSVAVMYGGLIIEEGGVLEVLSESLHPYTIGLMHAVPRFGVPKGGLSVVSGKSLDLGNLPLGCLFEPRCPSAVSECSTERPPMFIAGERHAVRCWKYRKEASV